MINVTTLTSNLSDLALVWCRASWIEEINGVKKIMYEHYEKEMTTKAVIHEKSAISTQTKRTVLSQEILRILLHCCHNIKTQHRLFACMSLTQRRQHSSICTRFLLSTACTGRHDLLRYGFWVSRLNKSTKLTKTQNTSFSFVDNW